MMCDAWARTWWLLPCSAFGHSLWRNPATMLWGRSSSPVEKSTWWGTEASCQRPAPPRHLCQLLAPRGSRAQPSEAWRWLQSCQRRGYRLMTNLKSELSNPGPSKLCEITTVYCWLKKKNNNNNKKRTKTLVLNPRSQRFTHMLSTRSFVVLALTFGSRIYFALIFDDGVR